MSLIVQSSTSAKWFFFRTLLSVWAGMGMMNGMGLRGVMGGWVGRGVVWRKGPIVVTQVERLESIEKSDGTY